MPVEEKSSIDSKSAYRPVQSMPLVIAPASERYNRAVGVINKLGELTSFQRRLMGYKEALSTAEKMLNANSASMKEIKEGGLLSKTLGYFKARHLEKDNTALNAQITEYRKDVQMLENVKLQPQIAAAGKELEKMVPNMGLRKEIIGEIQQKMSVKPDTMAKLHEVYTKMDKEAVDREMDKWAWQNSARLPEYMG
jgi:hypothetical protein